MITQQRVPELGEIVTVRQRRYLVEGIVASPGASDSTLVQLSCIDDDAQGQPLEVLWELELDAEVLSAEAWESIAQKGFLRLLSGYSQCPELLMCSSEVLVKVWFLLARQSDTRNVCWTVSR